MKVSDNGRVSGETAERNLRSVFTTYRSFDNLVSVSTAWSDINCTKLTEYSSPEKFVSAMNTINHERILRTLGHVATVGSLLWVSGLECRQRSRASRLCVQTRIALTGARRSVLGARASAAGCCRGGVVTG